MYLAVITCSNKIYNKQFLKTSLSRNNLTCVHLMIPLSATFSKKKHVVISTDVKVLNSFCSLSFEAASWLGSFKTEFHRKFPFGAILAFLSLFWQCWKFMIFAGGVHTICVYMGIIASYLIFVHSIDSSASVKRINWGEFFSYN